MKLYKLPYVMYDPSESTEDDKYMAEIPTLLGCRAWGDTPAETLDILHNLATAFIELYAERGQELPRALHSFVHGVDGVSLVARDSQSIPIECGKHLPDAPLPKSV